MFMGGSVLALCAILVVLVSESAARGHLGVNGLMGLRFGYVMASDEAWQAGHRAARVPLNLGGVILFVAGILVMVLPVSSDAKGALVGASLGILLLLVAVGAFVANREASRVFLDAADAADAADSTP